MAEAPGVYGNGIYRVGDVRISDLAGRRMLPIGNSNFAACVESSVFVDKTMLIADVLDGGSTATLFCRPRRFGKSLSISMLQRFFETPVPGASSAADTSPLFRGLAIWDAEGGRYRAHHQAYPVIRLTFGTVKQDSWAEAKSMLDHIIATEFDRHAYLRESDALTQQERELFAEISARRGSFAAMSSSLSALSRFLAKHHGSPCVILVDEYDAPVMAGYTAGFYGEVVSFLKTLLTGALKDNDALAFAVLTGVQRISKESIFSDLNNLTVNTSLNVASDERFGFTEDEMAALADYLGAKSSLPEARSWYDGYRFGGVDVFNPWSALNYFRDGCQPDVYWGNTSGNSVLGELVRSADAETLERLYTLMEPGGTVREALDLGVVFPDEGLPANAVWSMLYLAGYLTTDDTKMPNSTTRRRELRIPNREIRELYKAEILDRFAQAAGGGGLLDALHGALAAGEAEGAQADLERVLLSSASYFDLVSENSYHMLVVGLLFGIDGYEDPVSNRESGKGRFDICLIPLDADRDPVIVVELKHVKPGGVDALGLGSAASSALEQIGERAYARGAKIGAAGALLYGIVFSGKDVAVACKRDV